MHPVKRWALYFLHRSVDPQPADLRCNVVSGCRMLVCHADMGTAVEHAFWEYPRLLAKPQSKICLGQARQLPALWQQARKCDI